MLIFLPLSLCWLLFTVPWQPVQNNSWEEEQGDTRQRAQSQNFWLFCLYVLNPVVFIIIKCCEKPMFLSKVVYLHLFFFSCLCAACEDNISPDIPACLRCQRALITPPLIFRSCFCQMGLKKSEEVGAQMQLCLWHDQKTMINPHQLSQTER